MSIETYKFQFYKLIICNTKYYIYFLVNEIKIPIVI